MLRQSEIDRADIEARERRTVYESLLDDIARSSKAVEILKPQIAERDVRLEKLKTIGQLAAEIDTQAPGINGGLARYQFGELVVKSAKFEDQLKERAVRNLGLAEQRITAARTRLQEEFNESA